MAGSSGLREEQQEITPRNKVVKNHGVRDSWIRATVRKEDLAIEGRQIN